MLFVESFAAAASVTCLLYLGVVRAFRYRTLHRLQRLKPFESVGDMEEIIRVTTYRELSFLITLSLEFGLFKTYGVTSISKLLAKTKEFEKFPCRRYDDTDFIMREISENGITSDRGATAIGRLNYLHGRYPIANADLVYVLTVFAVEPFRWIGRFGYRSMDQVEIDATLVYYKMLGKKMNLTDVPETWDGMLAYNDAYEEQHMRFAPSNQVIAKATMGLFLAKIPGFLHRPVMACGIALMDERTRAAMGYAPPVPGLTSLCNALLHLHGLVTRWCLPPRPEWLSTRRTGRKASSCGRYRPYYHVHGEVYKEGYKIEELGPKSVEKNGCLGPIGE